MRLLFVGGTGLISSACSDLALARGHELFLLNRGSAPKYPMPQGAVSLRADMRDGSEDIAGMIAGLHFDAVVDFIAYSADDIRRDLGLFRERTDQFVFISSASAYQKPPAHFRITEETPLGNPYWDYSRGKIAAEQCLMESYVGEGFPATIVRPSLTYGPTQIPLCVGSWEHPWTLVDRIMRGRPAIVPGDGTSLWVLTWNADFAVGLLGLLGNPAAIGQAFQITADEVLSWDQIYLEVFEALGLAPRIVHVASETIASYWPHALGSLMGDKMYSLVFDNSKIKRVVPEFHCPVTWHDGLRRSLAWHRSHPQFQTIDHELDKLMEEMLTACERAKPSGNQIPR